MLLFLSLSVTFIPRSVISVSPIQSGRHLYISTSVQKYGQVMTVLKALTRSVMQVSSNVLYPLHLPICAEGRSPEDSAKGLD